MHQLQESHFNIKASFAMALGNWRRKNRVPLKQLASDLGLSIATVSAWERGERFPNERHFDMLANYTGLPPCRLLCMAADECMPTGCLKMRPKKL